jgi:hypothetical protein
MEINIDRYVPCTLQSNTNQERANQSHAQSKAAKPSSKNNGKNN